MYNIGDIVFWNGYRCVVENIIVCDNGVQYEIIGEENDHTFWTIAKDEDLNEG